MLHPYYFDNVPREERLGYLIGSAIASVIHAIQRRFPAEPPKRTA